MLLVDDRAGSVELIPYLPPELTAKHRLEAGDVAFFGNGPDGPLSYPIGIEYKTVSETIQCITSKRFVAEQFPKMAALYKRIYFVLEGEYQEAADGLLVIPQWKSGKKQWASYGWSMSYQQFDNWQNSLAETGKIIFKSVADRKHAAKAIFNLYRLWTKDYDKHSSLFAFDKSQLPPQIQEPSIVRLVAAQIPGIGWKRSEQVANSFPTVKQLVNAEEKQWQTIHGIGKTLAKRIVSILTEAS